MKGPVSPPRTISISVKGTNVIGSTFKEHKPGRTEFCKGAARPVLLTLGNRIITLIITPLGV